MATIFEKILPRTLEEEMKSSYIDYAMSVIVARALPDVRDGLKPVHRRVLYGMHDLGMAHNKPYKKSARIVAEVLGKYHPHGDTAVYDSMVRMVQDFSLRYRLVDGQGNFGSVDGDSPAAMRYTEARLARISEEMLRDLDKNTVDFIPNFDDPLQEPTVMPSYLPNLLINGSSGIATSTEQRIREVGRIASGSVYYVSLKGVTGAGHLDTAAVAEMVPRIKQHVKLPVGVGFGIRDAQTARAVAAVSDAVVIGSALVQLLEDARARQRGCGRDRLHRRHPRRPRFVKGTAP